MTKSERLTAAAVAATAVFVEVGLLVKFDALSIVEGLCFWAATVLLPLWALWPTIVKSDNE